MSPLTDFCFSQEAGQDAGHGSGSGRAHLRYSSLLPVPGHGLPPEHADAAELPELRASVCHLHHRAVLQER